MKKWFFVGLTFLAIVLLTAIVLNVPKFKIVNGFVAKNACSCIFVSERTTQDVLNSEFESFPLSLSAVEVDARRKIVTASVLGLGKQMAVYKDGLGCSLIHEEDNYNKKFSTQAPFISYLPFSPNWPYGEKDIEIANTKKDQFDHAFSFAFESRHLTRALLVIKNDTLIREQYAEGFDKNTRQIGWSMTKSIANILVGILVSKGLISLDDKPNIESWTHDERNQISIKDLLQMNSGLDWNEDYSALTDANKLLWMEEDVFKFASSKNLEGEVGNHWEYSSGTTNIISGIIRSKFENDIQYWGFPYVEFFSKLGIKNAQLEIDEAGNYVLSSFCYATARDWAKMGLLYLHKGQWGNLRLFDESYYDFSISPVENEKQYGAQLWLNTDHCNYKDVPSDMFSMNGYNGQKTIIIPSLNMVIVRMGSSSDIDWNHLIKEIILADSKSN